LILYFVLLVLQKFLLDMGILSIDFWIVPGQRGIEAGDLFKVWMWDAGIGLLYGLSFLTVPIAILFLAYATRRRRLRTFLTVPIAILLLVAAKKMSGSRGPSEVARRFPVAFFLAAAGVSLTLGGICSAYDAAWSASAAKEEGIVESPGPIPIVHFQQTPQSKGDYARVDTLHFIWYNRGQKVTVLFTPDDLHRVDSASIDGDHPLVAMACFSAAIVSLFVVGVNCARRIWHPLPAAEVMKRTGSAEESGEYFSAQLERLSLQQRDAIRRPEKGRA
jgi:hypothetical protein